MKLDLRLEDGKPCIVWTDCPDVREEHYMMFTLHDGHNEIPKEYIRRLKKPKNQGEVIECMRVLKGFAGVYGWGFE